MTSDTIVIGGGIVGLACAWEAAKRGRSVVLVERDAHAQSASVRNFGMIWPIGQPSGEPYRRALRSREHWLTLQREAGIWLEECGSLHLAHHQLEAQVLEELVASDRFAESSPTILTPSDISKRFPLVENNGLICGMYSRSECVVDPPKAIRRVTEYLVERYAVRVLAPATVVKVEMPTVTLASGEKLRSEQVLVCSGADFSTLFPKEYSASGIRRCKLQMLAAAPPVGADRIGVHLAAGLTLAHYKSFECCPSLPALKEWLAGEYPEYLRFGIHVMVSQNEIGEWILGDSHEYDGDIAFDQSERIDRLILDYLRRIVVVPTERITRRWFGIYPKHPSVGFYTISPQPGCTIINGVGGAGMTMSFGHVEHWWNEQSGAV